MRRVHIKAIKGTALPIALLLAGGLFFTGCSKDREQAEEMTDIIGTKLTLKITGIDESITVSTSGTEAKTTEEKSGMTKVLEYPEFDALLSVDNYLPLRSSAKAASNPLLAQSLKAVTIENGVKYRLYLFSQDGSRLISSTLLTSGTQASIDVLKGTTYRWAALSYNTAEDVPDILQESTKIVLPAGKDILYTSGEVVVPTGAGNINVPIDITFKHKFARLAVELNSQGMFANMTGAKVNVTGIKTATIDVVTGGLSDLVSADQEMPLTVFKDVDPLYQDDKITYVYTADPMAVTGGIKVGVSDLSIRIDDNTIRQFSAPVNFAFNITPVLGNSHRLLVNLVESPLTIDAVRWARQNLYYQAGHNPYRFHHTYAHSNARNTYFSFKGLVPDQFGINSDPCAQVYPAGIWRQASESDFRKLTGLLGLGGKTPAYGTVNNRGYYEYDAVGVAAPYPNNKLHFNFNGGSTAVSLLNGVVQATFGNYGTRVELWTGSSGLDLGGLAGLGAWYYSGSKNLLGGNSADLFASLLNVSIIGVNVIQSQMKNVRCVRK